ncbi:MAG TPA: ferritin-like domain-containing protein [Parafilimonas sp.]|nr:ferritin-like domain-containing protein [Parafilimonas sp.]
MKSTETNGARTASGAAPRKSDSSAARSNSRTTSNGSGHRENLSKIFEDTLKDIYWAEKHLTKALPKMSKAAYDEDLSAAFDAHLQETEMHVQRLEQVFEQLGKTAQAKKCPAMEGLVEEGKEAIEEYEEGYARDAALIIAAQKIEHYEIAAYGSLKAHAKMMGEDDIVSLLEETEEEEGNADKKLTEISGTVNQQAYNEGGES